ncbi:unnamed protein product [Linum trigynum]|uniref:Pentatricopeptide repeat-containing protein n=1 Tax=Linum trigynum TaxID=586398 RepID=A0AAV2CD14_9ROSI
MVKKQRMNNESYKFIMKALSDHGRLDKVLQLVDAMVDNEAINVNEELQEIVKGELNKEGRGDELDNLMEEKARLKPEAKAREGRKLPLLISFHLRTRKRRQDLQREMMLMLMRQLLLLQNLQRVKTNS